MDRQSAEKLVTQTFEHPFDKNQFHRFVKELLNHLDDSQERWLQQAGSRIKEAFRDKIRSFQRIGTYTDPKGRKIDVLVVNLQKESTLERARTFQRNFVADYLATGHGRDKDAAFAAFVSPTEEDWRFSFVKLEYSLEEKETGRVKERRELTPARRLSFLVGENEKSHTAQSQFLNLLQNDLSDPLLEEIEEAFQIEKVTKEFFRRYRELYNTLRDALNKLVKKNENVRKEFQEHANDLEEFVANFSKKLLGQIIFLYFLQKKGWFGVDRDKEWGSGNRKFLRHLFSNRAELGGKSGKSARPVNFFNDILEPLFYEALAKPKDYDYYSRFHCKIPFLNGGLFEPIFDYNWVHTDILLPDSLFSNNELTDKKDIGTGILDVFDRFNFTVNEAEPLEKEVAVDPEMLGKVFENLLPENERKGKGTYYTPRVIVHYMCQQSLINYLASHADTVDRNDIEILVRFGERFADFEARPTGLHQDKLLPVSVRENGAQLDRLLEDIAVCDPAIGSGAFPVGMMQEIVRTRLSLASVTGMPKLAPYELKRHAIQNCLYGVDIDPGSIEIAKLRLWLSLVVDEDNFKNIRPLPNLDYKIMQGNSLLEEFEGVKLFDERVLQTPVSRIEAEKSALDKRIREIEAQMLDLHARGGDTRELKKRFSKITDQLAKQKKEIGRPEEEETLTFLPEDEFSEAIAKLEELRRLHKQFFDSSSSDEKKIIKKNLDKIEWEFMEATLKEQGEKKALEELRKHRRDNRKPFFLWKLQFLEVFQDKGGFDIMIANPPYVRQEEIKEFKPALKRSYVTYTGTADLYVYFYEKSLRLLNSNGVMSFITSNKYFRAAYGEKLRQLLSRNTRLDQIIDFGDAPVFDATNYPCIVVLEDQPPNGNTLRALSWKPGDSIDTFEKIFNENSFRIDQSELTPDGWRLEKPDVLRLLDRLKATGRTLGEYVNRHIYRGLLTGLNEAFVVDRKIRDFLIREDKSSAEVLKPFLRGRDVKRWHAEFSDQYLIHIESSENRKHEWSDKPSKQAEKIFAETYPAIHDWFKPFRAKLIKRDDQGNYFWELRSCAYSENFQQTKILYQEIATYQAFAYDRSGAFSNNKTFLIPLDDLALLGLLNAKITWWFLNQVCSKLQGGALAMQTPYVFQIPIPDMTDSQKQVISTFVSFLIFLSKTVSDQISDLTGSRDRLMLRYFEQIIDAAVYELFFPDELHEAGKYFFQPLLEENLPDLRKPIEDGTTMLRRLFDRLFDQNHVIRQNIFFLDTLESIRTIEGKHETVLNRD
jgi:hypothetical protein